MLYGVMVGCMFVWLRIFWEEISRLLNLLLVVRVKKIIKLYCLIIIMMKSIVKKFVFFYVDDCREIRCLSIFGEIDRFDE